MAAARATQLFQNSRKGLTGFTNTGSKTSKVIISMQHHIEIALHVIVDKISYGMPIYSCLLCDSPIFLLETMLMNQVTGDLLSINQA
jgi:hypothetical protein